MTRPDPFGTAELRDRVLAGWSASVARFREDANAEEDYALGGYADRLVVELAQNAADAAVRAGVPGALRLCLRDGVLTAGNVGAPLDADGVEALSTLRASAKRQDEPGVVGRFGVGFAAVLAVSDEPSVRSTTGAVGWSRASTAAAVAELPGLADELDRRAGAVPVLRLPFPVDGGPAEGWDTEVRLPLRDAAAHERAVRLLAEVDPTLLLTLPALQRIELEIDGVSRSLARTTSDDDSCTVVDDGAAQRWRLRRAAGRLDPALLVDRPTEERGRSGWSLLWAVPVGDDGRPQPLPARLPPVVRAPTVTDERLGLPAVLAASLPLDPTRRHVAPGPLRDAVLGEAADAYCRLLRDLAGGPELLALVPTGLALGTVDGVLRAELERRLPGTAFLPLAADDELRQRPADAVVLDVDGAALVEVLADVLPGLLPAGWSGRGPAAALATLGVRRLPVAELVDALAGLDRPAPWWHRLYAALADAVPPGPGRDELRALPVPLADGRLVTGPRGLVLRGAAELPEGLALLGVRVVDTEAGHPLLLSLGAVAADPADLLADERLRAAVAESLDADDPEALAEVVLGLVAAARLVPGEHPWLGRLALPAGDGEWAPAEELLLPGGAWSRLAADDAPFGVVADDVVARWGAETLAAAGVLDGFAVVDDADVLLDPDETDHQLDAEDLWIEHVLDLLPPSDLPPTLPELTAVRDLELVRPDAWPEALALLAEPGLRGRVTDPAWVLTADGARVRVASYTAWWLSRWAELDGRPLTAYRLASAGDLAALYDPAPVDVDEQLLRAAGVRSSLTEVVADPRGVTDLLHRIADGARTLGVSDLAAVYAAVAAHERVGRRPDRLAAVRAGRVEVVEASEAVVLDAPDLLPLLAGRPLLPVEADLAVSLADALDLPLASELADFGVHGEPVTRTTWAAVPGAEQALRRSGQTTLPTTNVLAYQALSALDVDGRLVEVAWRATDGVDHVRADDVEALGRALAWRTNRWRQRAAFGEALRAAGDPAAATTLEVEDVL